jgi:hypothetical protein
MIPSGEFLVLRIHASGRQVLRRTCNFKKGNVKMSDSKILLTYKDAKGEYQIESVWASRKGDYYEINNIPFFAKNIALGDLVSVEEDEGALYFKELIKASGHSVVQLIILNGNDITQIGSELEKLGCTWEESNIRNWISVDIPQNVSYTFVKKYLDKGEKEERWSYREACLAQ